MESFSDIYPKISGWSEIETIFKPILDYATNANAVYDYTRLILEDEYFTGG